MDPSNYYPDRDGRFDALDRYDTTTSAMVQTQFPQARIVKAFNAIFANDLVRDARSNRQDERRALPIGGDDAQAKELVARFHRDIGFEPVDAGQLADSWRFERGKPVYCVPMQRAELKAGLAAAKREDV